MKKFAGVLIAFVMLFSLTACGGEKFTCTGEQDGQKGTVTGTVKDGKVTKIEMEIVTEAESEDAAKQSVALVNAFSSLGDEKGVTMSAKANGKKVTMNTVMDITKMDDEAKESASVDLSDLSKDKIIKLYEEQGFTCK